MTGTAPPNSPTRTANHAFRTQNATTLAGSAGFDHLNCSFPVSKGARSIEPALLIRLLLHMDQIASGDRNFKEIQAVEEKVEAHLSRSTAKKLPPELVTEVNKSVRNLAPMQILAIDHWISRRLETGATQRLDSYLRKEGLLSSVTRKDADLNALIVQIPKRSQAMIRDCLTMYEHQDKVKIWGFKHPLLKEAHISARQAALYIARDAEKYTGTSPVLPAATRIRKDMDSREMMQRRQEACPGM